MSSVESALERELRQCLEHFEAQWQSGAEVEINEFLRVPTSPSDSALFRRELLIELIMLDLEYRWRRNVATQQPTTVEDRITHHHGPLPDCPVLEDYVVRYPDVGTLDDLPLHVIADEYRVRHRWGDCPSRDEYGARFHTRGDALQSALSEMDELLNSQRQSGLRTRCPNCRESISLDHNAEMAEVRCPHCRSEFNVLYDESTDGVHHGSSIAHFDLVERPWQRKFRDGVESA